MGNRNNSNARNKGCKEGWKYHSGRLDCPSNLNGIKTFLPNKFQITLTATCQHRGRFRTACVKSVTGSSHWGLPMHSFCRCSLNREMSSGAVSPQRLFFFFQLLHCQPVRDGDVVPVISTQQTPTERAEGGYSVHLGHQTTIR